MGPVTAWAGRVEIMPSLPAFGYSTKLCAQEAERVPADGGSLTQGPAIVLRLLLHTPALQECVYITHQALSTEY